MKKTLAVILIGFILLLAGCIGGGQAPSQDNQTNNTQLPNPASVKCVEDGGRLEIVKAADGEYGVCIFSNGAKCEEWAYFRGECSPQKPNYCAVDADCACGTHKESGECFVGSKEFVNIEKQCPDYCTGIAGMFETKCVSHQCKIVKKEENGFCGWSTGGECESDADCMAGGCSGQVCQSKKEAPVVTTCEYRECYSAANYGLSCSCVNNKCEWSKSD